MTPKAHFLSQFSWFGIDCSVSRVRRKTAIVTLTNRETGDKREIKVGARAAANLQAIAGELTAFWDTAARRAHDVADPPDSSVFSDAGEPPDWSAEILGESAEVSDEDWSRIRPYFVRGESPVDAIKAWAVDAPAGVFDQPCVVFLTTNALYFDVRSQTLKPPEILAAALGDILRCETASNDIGGTRLGIAGVEGDTEQPAFMFVDLPRGERGAAFGHTVLQRGRTLS